MKTFLSAVLFAYFMVSANAAVTLAVTTTDAVTTATFPIALSLNGATATSVTTTSTITAPTGTANAYTAKFASGIPVQQTWTLTQDSSTGSAVGVTIAVTLGSQVSLSVSSTGGTAGSMAASATAVTSTATTCGNYYIDCVNGVITFNLYITTVASNACAFSISQVAAIAGILQYPTSSVAASPYTAVTAAITAASGVSGSPTTMVCGTGTSGTNTLLYFTSTYGSSTGDAQTAAFTKVKNAAASGSLNSNTGYVVTNLQTSLSGGSTAPSAQASNIASVNKSAGKLVVALFTTCVATFFGLVL